MRYFIGCFWLVLLVLGLSSYTIAEDFTLQYYLVKASSQTHELSKQEREGLLGQIEEVMQAALGIHMKLVQTLQVGEAEVQYQEGKYWMSKLEADESSIEVAFLQIKSLKEKPTNLMASIQLYRALKDLSSNFNAYNNMPFFCALVGDLAPEMELWADPVFYKLHLLPLAELKDVEKAPPQTQKGKPVPKGKKP